ncbi:hypothetical protein HHK36_026215 [Tetracentron sinense]|uniref:Retrotransposon gag domain-containing protein n=1 Tax=Tetracentron sinense TaxID=13715 RepID=A0A834YMK0_TETSI|nr:hypothetical protein HHK36_026215 [Tetracentron sinense]
MPWILNCMEPAISKTFMFVSTVKELWNAVTESYSFKKNYVRVYELIDTISKFRQGEKTLNEYYARLRGLSDELNHFQPISCSACAGEQRPSIEQKKMFDLIHQVNWEYEVVQANILEHETLLSLGTVFSLLQQEERCRIIMDTSNNTPERSALATNSYSRREDDSSRGRSVQVGGKESGVELGNVASSGESPKRFAERVDSILRFRAWEKMARGVFLIVILEGRLIWRTDVPILLEPQPQNTMEALPAKLRSSEQGSKPCAGAPPCWFAGTFMEMTRCL